MEPLMARPRKFSLHSEISLPSPNLPYQVSPTAAADTEAPSERNVEEIHFSVLHDLLQQRYHLHQSFFGKLPARHCAFLAVAFLGIFFLLSSMLSSSTLQLKSLPYYTLGDHEADDFTLGGLLSEESDRTQCYSRGLIHRLRVASPHVPSPYLVKALRDYEALHQRCGPGTEAFNKSALDLELALTGQGKQEIDGDCRYIVWTANSGLGNRIISIAASFVYALLTRRVLVLDGSSDMSQLLCEPFPGEISWILSPDFPPLSTLLLNQCSPHRFGLHLQQGTILSSRRDPPEIDQKTLFPSTLTSQPSSIFSYVYLLHDYDFFDKLFFCDEEQSSLQAIPWIILSTNMYFVPNLYLYLPQFREELNRLFPESDTIFHHISRYLFFPTNAVWSWMMRHYDAYLRKSSRILGVQIRSFEYPPVMHPELTDQILRCALENHLLPRISKVEGREHLSTGNSTAVLVTSLLPDYSEQIKEFYAEHSTETGEAVSVHQPSHEVHQNTKAHGHNVKAWGEMCLLSFSDNLVTSPMSTFGYVAQGLAGIRPWILVAQSSDTDSHFFQASSSESASPACSQVLSMDPCFHAPPYYNCAESRGDDTSTVLPCVRHCEDVSWGLKVFSQASLI
ncbi:hypothetical protein KP509_02G032400 [Ceratopteris richardii]|uniref:Fucosyltransferase n=1 Tax=Ceratopteris richardii TaxID=49495 RepID=A0A8T2V4G6_CERRI|nr:hypothetical protein KP509_02G032400 [Ceratopteris richardii]